MPAGATLYLPKYVKSLGPDVSFWHRPAPKAYAAVLSEFLRLDVPVDRWADPGFAPVLREFQARFKQTRSEEGAVMATVLAYVIADLHSSDRAEILAEFRGSEEMESLLQRGLSERAEQTLAVATCAAGQETSDPTDSSC